MYRVRRVVGFAVIPDQLNVIENFLNVVVSIVLELLVDCAQIHGVFDEVAIVEQTHSSDKLEGTFPIHRGSKVERLVSIEQRLQNDFHFLCFFLAQICFGGKLQR